MAEFAFGLASRHGLGARVRRGDFPCFNEAAGVGEVVRTVREHLPSVFVVDDGWTDETAARATAAGAELVRPAANRVNPRRYWQNRFNTFLVHFKDDKVSQIQD